MPAPFGLRRGMDAQIAGTANVLIAAWTTAGTDKWGSGPITTAVSSDGGISWKPGPNPADDGSTTGHGFIDIAADRQGAFHLTWLDSRDGMQGLRYARSVDGGKSWSKNATLKTGTCECCSNAFALGADGALAILFRDKAPRDMAVVASVDAGKTWGKPANAAGFGWEFDGCPHVGGGIAFGGAASKELHAAVWTGGGARPGVYYSNSRDAVAWTEPRAIGSDSASHPDLAARDDGRVAVAWVDGGSGMAKVFASVSADSGRTWSTAKELSSVKSQASHPRIVSTRAAFLALWTEHADDGASKVVSAILEAR